MQHFAGWTTMSDGTEHGQTFDAPPEQAPSPYNEIASADESSRQAVPEQIGSLQEGFGFVPSSSAPAEPESFGPENAGEGTGTETPEDAPASFDEAFDVLDRQAEQMRMLRSRLEKLFDDGAERDRAMKRLEQELDATRADNERNRMMVADLRGELGKQDRLIQSVHETVAELARTLQSATSSWSESRAA